MRDASCMQQLPPGPAQPPLVQTMRWLVRPLEFLDACQRRHGDAFSLTFLGFQTPMVMLSDPAAIRALYTTRHDLPPGRTVALGPIMGPRSVLLLEGHDHLARRKAMLPPFHGERMRAYEPVMAEIVEREIDTWPRDRPFALHPHMQSVTLEVIMRAVFGVEDPERRERLRALLPDLLGATASPRLQLRVLLAQRFGRGNPLEELGRLMAEVDAVLYEEIADRRADPAVAERDDILSLLTAARFEDGGAMSDSELRDQLMTLLLAGHETTATALAWTFDLLLHDEPRLARLREELASGEETYLRAVISEALRLRPVIPLAGRRLSAPLPVNGYELPAGTDVTPAIWLIHTRADLYPEPYAFRPERFLEDPPDTYSWIPFGGGVRRCLGAAFAEFEMRVVLATVLRTSDIRPASRRRERIARRNVTLAPRRGTRVLVRT